MITILYIITDLNVGGAENLLLRLLSKLDKDKYNPVVISLVSKGRIGKKIGTFLVVIYHIDQIII